MSIWGVFIAAGLLTYGMRLFFILLVGKKEIPTNVKNTLQFVPPAVLTAIIIPDVLFSDNVLNISMSNYRIFATILACFVAWKTKNAILTVVIGMLVIWSLQYLNI